MDMETLAMLSVGVYRDVPARTMLIVLTNITFSRSPGFYDAIDPVLEKARLTGSRHGEDRLGCRPAGC